MRWTARAAVCAAVLVSACGSSKAVPSSTTVSRAALGHRYQQIADPANARVAAAKAHLDADSNDLRLAQTDLAAIASAKEDFDAALVRLELPAVFQPDTSRLLSADRVLEARLGAAASASSVQQLATMLPGILSADQGAVAAADALRRDLGLGPAP
jgi:hypothetical protein